MVHKSEKCTTKWGKMGRKNLDFAPFFEVVVQFWYTNRNLWYTFFGVYHKRNYHFINQIFLRYGKCTDNKSDFSTAERLQRLSRKPLSKSKCIIHRERTRILTGVSVLKHIRLKRQTYETYLHIITSHLVSVKIW